jgi:hypothetical protein
MITLIEDNQTHNYRVWHSDVIEKHHEELILSLLEAEKIFEERFGKIKNRDLTWSYQSYNIWALTSPSPVWFQLYQDLIEVIKKHRKWEIPLWLESWANIHRDHKVLDWHTHYWPIHGYISIDPKNTVTEFEEYKILNNIGQIYIGPGRRLHRVVSNEFTDFSTPRITVGFDLAFNFVDEKMPLDYQLIPIII